MENSKHNNNEVTKETSESQGILDSKPSSVTTRNSTENTTGNATENLFKKSTENESTKPLNIPKLIGKIIIVLLSSIILVFLLAIGGLNIFKHFYYDDYYSALTKVGKIAGLNDGFVPQGLTYNNGIFYSVGYMTDGSPTRLYISNSTQNQLKNKNSKSKPYYVTLKSNGQDFFGHTGGIQYEDGLFYLANESDGLYIFDAHQLENAQPRENCSKDGNSTNESSGKNNTAPSIEIGSPIKLQNHTSFVFSNSDFLYVGEFNNDAKYACTNTISYNNVTHNAIVEKYNISQLADYAAALSSLSAFSQQNISSSALAPAPESALAPAPASNSDLATTQTQTLTQTQTQVPTQIPAPVAVYSIPNEIQGFAITDEGKIVLSRSYAVTSSDFFIYEPQEQTATAQTYHNAPVFFLDKPTKTVKGPAMSEDLDIVNGLVVTHFESACKKYFFGKLFFANYIAGLDF